ncbi:hypothetical protein HHK36_028903 [Tetracentron sinense]|uniref:DNA sliding clamp PCNA n=1 Tax=Tetracentron sinense TaxID=13715 RepID=A0A835D0W2_TETSI|nr:hypothetical protein HHK36_028903 [Tetracentron sinense]
MDQSKMFELQLTSGVQFMAVKNLIRDFGCFEAIVDISSTGLSLQAKDLNNRDTLVLHLNRNAFDHYHCDHNFSMGIGIYWVFNILDCAFCDYTIKIKGGDNGNDTVLFTIKGHREDEILQVSYKLWEYENECFNIHRGEYEVTVDMPSEEFRRICKILHDFSNTATISVANERVKFSARVDNGSADSNLPKSINSLEVVVMGSYDLFLVSLVQPKETATVYTDLTDPVSFSFSLENWHSFTMATSISKMVMIKMSLGLPVVVEYTIEHKGYMRFDLS